MTNLGDHPGFLGWMSQGVLLIHADWPAYPQEHGWQVALTAFGQFPKRTTFSEIDDIDQCYLFLVGPRSGIEDPIADRHFHVAAWHADVFDLHRQDLVTGATRITLAEWVERRRMELAKLYYEDAAGRRVPLPPPSIDDFGDEPEALRLMIGSAGIELTDLGWRTLEQVLAARADTLHEAIRRRVLPIVATGQFDSAIREGCLVIEHRLRGSFNTALFGTQLVHGYITYLRSTGRLIEAYLKGLECELRTVFKYVRNDYMHNIKEVTRSQCFAILARLSAILTSLDQMEAALAAD